MDFHYHTKHKLTNNSWIPFGNSVNSKRGLRREKTEFASQFLPGLISCGSFPGESGTLSFRPHYQTDVTVHGDEHNTERKHRQHVNFSRPFASVPAVSAGMTHLDTSHDANTRVDVTVSNVGISGFDIVAEEFYYDTVVYVVNVMWMACNSN
ncbi:hypothetical protein BaRGS_00025877 [Batillaria attramentaria]|uniref:H-type lectin domain-containing protein n=1 Tax=Batillaria attramentaria TaxID=370345 RepID=A0ABD0K695_9CAEN